MSIGPASLLFALADGTLHGVLMVCLEALSILTSLLLILLCACINSNFSQIGLAERVMCAFTPRDFWYPSIVDTAASDSTADSDGANGSRQPVRQAERE
ncbi:unnamed protein product [Vitrella brassicaformis CCMP3155]|uniref:Uncharacterized protein n=1 Tax=Vitrella brassicaformis (strain CCMP3155) TaxID=1169540 RepID=A0A0G4G722_VITBC|nr:unnamed protein product [Vitrella brassicaformis CCMP3155]|eukprot:CEM24019.1 unnamed protein product [Vitrella brassicaformis CCMP3155]